MIHKFKDYDYSAFDDRKLRRISIIKSHLRYVVLVGLVGLLLLSFGTIHWTLTLAGILCITFAFPLIVFVLRSQTPGDLFAKQNNLSRPFMKNDSYYYFLYKEYKEAMDSALSKTSAVPWGLPIGNGELGITFLNNLDVLVWGRLSKNFPHLVIDATGNDRFIGNNVDRDELPLERVSLEGDFPEYFKVYMEKDQEVLSLQILSPDRMANMIDKMPKFDIEIKGNHIKVYAVNMQQNSEAMRSFMSILEKLDEDLKINRLNNIKVS